ncbi:MAG: Clp protease ClpP [Candidatus Competibacteraceae bacterium]|nr:Clp protease ClpP [Candidatus Competibacteraceae bacterium]
MKKTWYRIRAARKTAEIRIYEEIGAWGITAKQFADDLAALGDLTAINVRINSPGGDVFEALAIHNALQRHPAKVTTYIDGLCASAATLIALAGDETHMVSNGMYMIHEPWTMAGGDAETMQKSADLLNVTADQIVTMYARKTGIAADDLRAKMQVETWMTAQEALDEGFIDVIDEALRVAAKAHDLSRFTHPPTMTKEAAMADPVIPETPPIADPVPVVPPADPVPPVDPVERPMEPVALARMCLAKNEPGLTPILLATPHTETQVTARLEQAASIRTLCAAVRLSDQADALIAAGKTTDQAKLALWDVLAMRDQAMPTIDSTPPSPIPDGLPIEQRCEMEWQRNPTLRAEFGELSIYQSFARAQDAGRVKVYGGSQ